MARTTASLALLGILLVAGCASPKLTDPARSATEQLLLSTAADLALKEVDLSPLAGRRVFLDTANFEATDKGYVVGAVNSLLTQQGGCLAPDKAKAEVILAIWSGALSIDRSDFLLGVPNLAVPLPFGGQVQTPEIALLKHISRTGIAKLGLHAYEAASGKHVLAIGPLAGRSRYGLWTLVGLTFDFSNIPEKHRKGWVDR